MPALGLLSRRAIEAALLTAFKACRRVAACVLGVSHPPAPAYRPRRGRVVCWQVIDEILKGLEPKVSRARSCSPRWRLILIDD